MLSESKITEEEQDIFFGIINRFIGYFSLKAQGRSTNDTANEYPFVAMDTRQIYDQLDFVKNYLQLSYEGTRPSFVDVGCGIGNVLIFAEQFLFDVYGIEKDEYTVRIAEDLIGKNRIEAADITVYPDYARFDVIYYFCPLPNHEPQKKLECYIEDEMKSGAILIANRKKSMKIDKDPRFNRLSNKLPIWQKIS